MSRDDGFPVADVDSSYLDDPKMRDLWQRLKDPDRMARAVVLHTATVLASWRQGERVSVTQAAPLWLLVDSDLIGALRAAHLIDKDRKIPLASWEDWFGPAFNRRETRREAGRTGGQASVKQRSSDAQPTVLRPGKLTSTDAEPVRPSVPSGPTRPSVPSIRSAGGGPHARGGDPRPLGEILLDNGMDAAIIKGRTS